MGDTKNPGAFHRKPMDRRLVREVGASPNIWKHNCLQLAQVTKKQVTFILKLVQCIFVDLQRGAFFRGEVNS